ncbi:hypothetical protein ACNKHR_12125 [Shigella flexneri]
MQHNRGFMADNKPELQRGLEARHIELIARGAPLASACLWGRQYPEMGRAIRIVGLYHRRGCSSLFIMRSMGEMLSSNRLPVRSPFMRIVI